MKFLVLEKSNLRLEIIKIYNHFDLYYCKDKDGVEYMLSPKKFKFKVEEE